MRITKPRTLLVCLAFLAMISAANADNWDYNGSGFPEPYQLLAAAAPPQVSQNLQPVQAPKTKPIYKVKPQKIVKCRPPEGYVAGTIFDRVGPQCVLPVGRTKGWELGAEAFYARTKGNLRFIRGTYYAAQETQRNVDLNSELGLPEHYWIASFSAAYRFNPVWSLRYSLMPIVMDGSGSTGRAFTFGNNSHFTGANNRVKWERLYHRLGLSYDPIRTISSRISVFGDYVRITERISVIQPGCCGDKMDNDVDMAMAGIEIEKCLKTGRLCNTLSVECKAGVAFGDDSIGGDIATGVKYSIPLNNGRWGYVKGGYRFITYKKKASDFNQIDTAMEGGFVQAGFVF